MARYRTAQALVAASACLAPVALLHASFAQGSPPARSLPSPFTGHWAWNKDQSVLPRGERPPTGFTVDVGRVDATHVQWSITMRGANGQPGTERFDIPGNGEFYPVSADTTAAVALTPVSLQVTFRSQDGTNDALTCTVSPDDRQLTCNGSLSQRDGTTQRYVDVFDRS